jgi:integrase
MDAVAARERTSRRLMASFHSKDGYLYIDFRWRGLRCREATRLRDTTENRTQVRRTVRQIDGEIAARTFDYLKWFPEGRRAALFTPPESVAPPLYRDHVTKWLDDKQARLGAGTAYDWRRIVESRLIPTFGGLPVPEIDVERIEGWIAALKRGTAAAPPAPDTADRRRKPREPKKLSNRRVNIILKVLRQSLDRAVSKEWLPENPARKIELLREEKPDIDPFSLAEVKTFLGSGLEDEDDRRYFRVAFFSGLRPGEQAGLQWDDIDWERKIICVRRSIGRFGNGPTKTVQSKRDVAMLPIVEETLSAHRRASDQRSPWIFANRDGGPIDVTNLRERVWRPALRQAKLRARMLYQTRHTFTTLMLELGESPGWVARQLGHTNAEMVYRRYHRFIPNLRGRDGVNAARGLATEGL